ncbi:cation:proton antiporter, partial [Thermococcus sp. M39]|nr:cation:proton antiporter [Thermococcus sp. M39]
IIVISSAIALIAYMRVFYVIWLGKPKEGLETKEPLSMSLVCLLLALTVIVIGLTAPVVIDKLIEPATAQAIDYQKYIGVILELAKNLR